MKVVKRFKKDKFLHTYYADGLRGLRLTASVKSCCWSVDQIDFVYISPTAPNMLKIESAHRLNLHLKINLYQTAAPTPIQRC